MRPRIHYYTDDAVFWRTPEARARIEGTILRPESLCCEILGREAVAGVVRDWFDRAAAPTPVIGAMYVYETYHRDLSAQLRAGHQPRDFESHPAPMLALRYDEILELKGTISDLYWGPDLP